MKRHDQTKGTQRSQKGGNSQSKDIGQHESDKNRTRTAVPTIDNASGPAPPGGRVVIAHALYRMRAQWGVKFEYLVRTQPRAHPLLYASTPRKIHSQKRQMGMPAPGPSHAISGGGQDRPRILVQANGGQQAQTLIADSGHFGSMEASKRNHAIRCVTIGLSPVTLHKGVPLKMSRAAHFRLSSMCIAKLLSWYKTLMSAISANARDR